MAERDYANGASLPRDNVDLRGKEIGVAWPYSNQFEHDEGEGSDEAVGRDPNDGGASRVYPDWWSSDQTEDE